MEHTANSVRDWALREGIRIKILGDLDDHRIPDSSRDALRKLEADSMEKCNTNTNDDDRQEESLTLCIAINYGGRNDIINASRKLAELIASGDMTPDDVNSETFGNLLCTAGVPDPDLVIRTGGERRLSNFLIWNCAYAEIYFSDVLWPDFNANELDVAMEWYQGRDRRFGGRLKTQGGEQQSDS